MGCFLFACLARTGNRQMAMSLNETTRTEPAEAIAGFGRAAGRDESARKILPWLLVLFFGSGCAALIYEIVWLQILQLVIGLTGVSLGILLGVFMGGMCLGSFLLPRFVSPRSHPLKVYALLELGMGLFGLLILVAWPRLGDLYAAWAAPGWKSILCRSVLAASCLLPPTLLMGATLPAVARWVDASPRGVSWLGFFYGGNIAGALLGCVLAGFYLLRVYNMATATYVAASINGALAMLAYVLSGRARFAGTSLGGTSSRESPVLSGEDQELAGARPSDGQDSGRGCTWRSHYRVWGLSEPRLYGRGSCPLCWGRLSTRFRSYWRSSS